MANREGNQHAPQRLLLSLLQLGEEVQRILRGLRLGARLGRLGVEVGHALHLPGAHALDLLLTFDGHLAQVLGGQVEEMRLGGQRRGVRGCGAGERLGGLEAQRLNVEGTAACRVVHALGQLRRAGAGVRAAQVHVALLAGGQRRTAGGALAGHDELTFGAVAQGDHGGDDFGNHVACLAQHHGVADEHALSLDHVLVVQGGPLHGRARDKHGLHDAVGGHAAGASHVHADVQQLGVHLFGRVLVRHGPARHARGVAQLRLGCEIVDLDDDAVNLVHEGVALLAVAVDEVEDALDRIGQLTVGAHGQAPGGEQVVGLKLGVNLQAGTRADAVHVHAQRSGGGHRRVLLAQRTCRCVTRVREGVLAGGNHGLVELLEVGGGDEHLAANLDFFGVALAAQLLRDAGDGAHVVGDVLAGGAVTAGCRAHEGAVAVKQVHGQAVDLQLGEPARGGAGKVADALLGLGQPGAQLLEGEDVLEGVHAFQVGDGREGFDGFAADLLGGRVVGDDERVLGLDDFEAAVESIVLGI